MSNSTTITNERLYFLFRIACNNTMVAPFPCCGKAMLFFFFDAGWQRQTSASILVLFLIFSVRFYFQNSMGLRERWGRGRYKKRERAWERERACNREKEKDGASIAMRHGRMHLAQTYQSLYRVLGKHCNLGLSMPWCLNYQWPTTHPFSSAKESPHQRQHDFKRVLNARDASEHP